MSRWGDEKTLFFIACYKKQECLWNPTSFFYKSKEARANAYAALLEQFEDDSMTVQLVKTKIKNIRTTYHQELNKIRYSRLWGAQQEYKPTLCWFDAVDEFLGETVRKEPLDRITPQICKKFNNFKRKLTSPSDLDVSASAQTAGTAAQTAGTAAQMTGTAAQTAGTAAQTAGTAAQMTGTAAQTAGTAAQMTGTAAQTAGTAAQTAGTTEQSAGIAAQPPSHDQELPAKKTMKIVSKKLMKRQDDETDSEKSDTSIRLQNTPAFINNAGLCEDEFHFFGMNVAAQLRRLPVQAALQLQTEFQSALYLARVHGRISPAAEDMEDTMQTVEEISDSDSVEHVVDSKEFHVDIQLPIERQEPHDSIGTVRVIK